MKKLLSLAALALLAACEPTAPPDPYDVSKMDFTPKAAKITAQSHKGAFAEGASLSMGAQLKRLDPAPVKTVRLDTTHKVIEIAPGVKFSAWTFGDQVPGPTVRARVGDKIRFVMTNRSDEPAPMPQLVAAPMMHSMDFHAAMVSPQDKYRSIAPGQTIEFEFTANYPGIFMYHCGTPMILEHIASGMYGAVIVEPRGGYPTKADREYVVIQSEFYVKPSPGKQKVDGGPLYVLDGERLRAAQPSHTVFNGRHNGMVANPLAAKPGERVRMFVLNVGPSRTSSFHVVGTIFDRVWMEGNPDNQMRGMQTVLLGSSSTSSRRKAPPSWSTTTSPMLRRGRSAWCRPRPSRRPMSSSTTTCRPRLRRPTRTPLPASRRSRASASPAIRWAAGASSVPMSPASPSGATRRGSRAGSRSRRRCCRPTPPPRPC